MSTISSIARNTFYQATSRIIGTIIGLAIVGMMTRYLGQTGYGHYTTIIAFLQFFGVLVDFGLQMTTTKTLSEPGIDQKKVFGNIFIIRLTSSILFLGSAAVLVWLLPYPLIVKQGVSVASLSFFFVSLQSIFISVFQKHLNMARVAVAEVWNRSIALLGVWWAISTGQNLLYIIGAIVAGNMISFSILFFSSFKYFTIKPEVDFRVWKKIWHAAWPLAITIALTLVYFRADTIILSLMRPAHEVGIYGATYKVLEVLVQFPYLFLGLILPLLTKFFTVNRKIFELTIQKSLDFMFILVVPMILSTLVLGEKVMVFVAGPEFIVSGVLLKILIFAAASIYIGALFGYAIVAADLQKKMIKFYLIDALISLPLYILLIPIYTYWAAAYLTIFTEVIITISAFYVLKRYTHIKLNFNILTKTLVAGLIMSAVLMLFNDLGLITLVILGTIIYFWALYALRGISKNTVREIINIRQQ